MNLRFYKPFNRVGDNCIRVYRYHRMKCNAREYTLNKMLDNCKRLKSPPDQVEQIEMAIRENEKKLNDLKKVESQVYCHASTDYYHRPKTPCPINTGGHL